MRWKGTADVKTVRIRKGRVVAIRNVLHHHHPFTDLDELSVDLDVLGGDSAASAMDDRRDPQDFLDCRGPGFGILLKLRQLVGVYSGP